MTKRAGRTTGGAIFITLLLAAVAAGWRPVSGHPADEAVIYHYLWFEVRDQELELQHGLVVGGLLAKELWPALDTDRDGNLSDEEQQRFAVSETGAVTLQINGVPSPWSMKQIQTPTYQEFTAGQFPVISVRLATPLPAGGVRQHFSVFDNSFPQQPGMFPQPVIRAAKHRVGTLEVRDQGRRVEFWLERAPGSPRSPSPGSGTERTGAAGRDAKSTSVDGTPVSADRRALDERVLSKRDWFSGAPLERPVASTPEGKVLYAGSRPARPTGDTDSAPPVPAAVFVVAALLGAAFGGRLPVPGRRSGAAAPVDEYSFALFQLAIVFFIGTLAMWLGETWLESGTRLGVRLGCAVIGAGLGIGMLRRALLAPHGSAGGPALSHLDLEPAGFGARGPEAGRDYEPPHDYPLTPRRPTRNWSSQDGSVGGRSAGPPASKREWAAELLALLLIAAAGGQRGWLPAWFGVVLVVAALAVVLRLRAAVGHGLAAWLARVQSAAGVGVLVLALWLALQTLTLLGWMGGSSHLDMWSPGAKPA